MPSCQILILLVALFAARCQGELLQQVGDLPRRSDGRFTATALRNIQAAEETAVAAAATLAESAAMAAAAVDPAQVKNPQLTALQNVKKAIDTTNKLPWTGIDYCFWPQIKCNSANDVIAINIWAATTNRANLTGRLPSVSVLKNLPKLTNLTIGDNRNITGPIPEGYAELVNLQDLRLGNNRLVGTLPEGLFTLRNLKVLYLYTNRFSGKIPSTWSSMTEMTDLQISGNLLTGGLPVSWKSMTKLRYLYLHDNRLVGAVPTTWGAFVQLAEITAYNLRLDRQMPSAMRAWRSLESLLMYNNTIPGTFPSSWISLRKINYLDLSSNRLQGTIPPSFGPTWQLLGQGETGGFFVDKNPLLTGCLPKEWEPNLPPVKYDTLGTAITGFCK